MEKKLVYHDSYLFHNTSTLPGTFLKEGKLAGFRDSQTASYFLGVNMEPIINQGFCLGHTWKFHLPAVKALVNNKNSKTYIKNNLFVMAIILILNEIVLSDVSFEVVIL